MEDLIQNAIEKSFKEAEQVLALFNSNKEHFSALSQLSSKIAECFSREGKVLISGNGGSHCDALHFAEEFTGRYRESRKALPVIALGEASHSTCVGNDYGFDEIFKRGVEAFGQEGDVFIGLSTSGNSKNVMLALEAAKSKGLTSVLFLGKDGGQMKGQADFEWIVQAQTSDRIQEVHMAALHILIEAVERRLFPELYKN